MFLRIDRAKLCAMAHRLGPPVVHEMTSRRSCAAICVKVRVPLSFKVKCLQLDDLFENDMKQNIEWLVEICWLFDFVV